LDSVKNLVYENFTLAEVLAFLKLHSYEKNETICLIGSKRISYDIWPELIDIPLPIYKRIFPDSEAYLKIERQKVRNELSINQSVGRVVIERGEKITIEKKYQKLYWVHELDDYIQLILLDEGKYYPKGYLVHLSKEKLEFIDELLIFDSFVDAGDIEIVLGCLYDDSLKIWDIHNSTTKSDGELADTVQINYSIHPDGRISKLSESLLGN
jgi:hypothetical protein